MSAILTKRVNREIKDLATASIEGCSCAPTDDIHIWNASLQGPEGSPYEGGTFEFSIKLPPDYPFRPPHVTARTKIYHCNINSSGGICLDILKHSWSPALSITKVLLSISSLLTDPNPDDPLVPELAALYKKNRKLHDRTAREWTTQYAKPKIVEKPANVSTKPEVIELD